MSTTNCNIAYDSKTTINNTGFMKSRFLDDNLSVTILLKVIKDIGEGKIKKYIFSIKIRRGRAWHSIGT